MRGGFVVLVGVAGFEPTTSASRTQRATGLRYTPNTIYNALFVLSLPT